MYLRHENDLLKNRAAAFQDNGKKKRLLCGFR